MSDLRYRRNEDYLRFVEIMEEIMFEHGGHGEHTDRRLASLRDAAAEQLRLAVARSHL